MTILTLRAEVERLQKQNAVMREALYAARQVIDTYEPAPMANVEARWKIENALAPDAGSALLTREQVQPLVDALRILWADGQCVNPENLKPFSEGLYLTAWNLRKQTEKALAHARTLVFHS